MLAPHQLGDPSPAHRERSRPESRFSAAARTLLHGTLTGSSRQFSGNFRGLRRERPRAKTGWRADRHSNSQWSFVRSGSRELNATPIQRSNPKSGSNLETGLRTADAEKRSSWCHRPRLWRSPAEQMSPICGQMWRFHINGKERGRDPDCVAEREGFEPSIELLTL